MEKLIIFSLLAVGAVTNADLITPVDLCPDSSVGFISVQVNTSLGVCPELPCQFYRGDDVIATITFEVPYDDVNEITKKVNVSFGTTQLQFPLPNANKGCDDLQDLLTCPLYAGDIAKLRITMPVSKLYPKITNMILDFYLVNENNSNAKESNLLACFQVVADIVDPPNKLHPIGNKNLPPLMQKLINGN